jgi:hypothetical protein
MGSQDSFGQEPTRLVELTVTVRVRVSEIDFAADIHRQIDALAVLLDKEGYGWNVPHAQEVEDPNEQYYTGDDAAGPGV